MRNQSKTLIFGIGNCGRADDGLGWAFLDKIKPHLPNNYDVEYRYQLQIDDAELVAQYQTVFFIDAHKNSFEKGYLFEVCHPRATDSFTSHELDPKSVLLLTKTIYHKTPEAYLLGITGEKFCLSMGLSNIAQINLSNALDFFNEKILNLVN